MNIYLFELKNQIKSTLLWSVGFIVLMIVLYQGVYPVFNSSLQDIIQAISNMPPEFTKAFSFDLNSMADFGGFYEFVFAYFSLMGAIMASSCALSIYAREKKVKCVDFLLTKPVSRTSVFFQKFFAGLTLLVGFNCIYVIITTFFGMHYGKSLEEMLLASSMMFLTQCFFYALGVLVANFLRRVRSVSNIATTLGFIGFILSAIYNILEIKSMRYVAPLKYFDPMQFFTPTTGETVVMIFGLCLLLLFLGVSYMKFKQEDMKAV